jgi:hypothetical protein
MALVCLILAVVPYPASGSLFGPVRFEVSAQGLNIRGDLYGRVIPLSALQIPAARCVDVKQEPQYRLWIKLNGAGLPGYHSGWFLTRNKEKVLAFLTRTDVVAYLPTTQGYTLMVSPEQPAEFLAALQSPGEGVRVFPIAASH